MNKTKIEWCDYTWNPVVGCKHGCSYCYAKKINNRFKFIEKWDEPKLFELRLREPYDLVKPSIIFVGSMCDLFGDWVDSRWIEKVLEVCKNCPQHTFMFLTKNHIGYNGFTFPENCMIGITMTVGSDTIVKEFVSHSSHDLRFVSAEPLLGSFRNTTFAGIDFVIVGAMTGANPVFPQKEWIESIKHENLFYKSNIEKYL